MKNSLAGLTRRVITAEKQVTELEDEVQKISKQQKNTKIFKIHK